jgi:thymidine kinase
MFCGKTEELIRRLRRAMYAQQKIRVFKPNIDDRYADLEIVSHTQQRLKAESVQGALHIEQACGDGVEVIGIDEAQFFGEEIVGVANRLADRRKRVIIAGLDQDFRGQPFGAMPQLMACAEFVSKMLSICVNCGNPAGRSQRLVASEDRVMVGAMESYEARCRRCHRSSVVTPTARHQAALF